jgi:(heptosyl)LPS beta-1,4-glucosyltransferase
MKISAVINVRNEAEFLEEALKSLKFVDEIIVVDMQSTDSSLSIAKKFDAKIYSHKPLSFVEPARNFGIKKATGDWILILDPDERISDTLAKELKKIADDDQGITYVRLPRKNIVFNKWLKNSRWWPDYNIRFFCKGAVEWEDKIHSIPITTGKGIDLEEREDLAIIHNHYSSLSQFILRMDRYTDAQAKELFEKGEKVLWFDFLKKPLAEFLSRFFFAKGYNDGLHGLVLAILQAVSEFIVVGKCWEKQGFKEKDLSLLEIKKEFKVLRKEIDYWIKNEIIASSGFVKSVFLKTKRKLLK